VLKLKALQAYLNDKGGYKYLGKRTSVWFEQTEQN